MGVRFAEFVSDPAMLATIGDNVRMSKSTSRPLKASKRI